MKTPQRFTGRAGGKLPGRVRRALDGAVDTARRVDESLTVDKSGRQGVNLARTGGLTLGPDGLQLDSQAVGDKNHAPMALSKDVSSSATLADLISAYNELLSELRRTKRMRG